VKAKATATSASNKFSNFLDPEQKNTLTFLRWPSIDWFIQRSAAEGWIQVVGLRISE
jgi:hypothetical protein